jgi:hypothetical protein
MLCFCTSLFQGFEPTFGASETLRATSQPCAWLTAALDDEDEGGVPVDAHDVCWWLMMEIEF